MIRRTILGGILALTAAACGGDAVESAEGAAVESAEGAAVESAEADACTAAPPWLVAHIEGGLTTEGATLSDAQALLAADLTGPPIVQSDRWAEAWWIAARISGGGADDVGVWVTNSLDESSGRISSGLIFGVNSAAAAHSDWGALIGTPVSGTGIEEAEACVEG